MIGIRERLEIRRDIDIDVEIGFSQGGG